MEYLPVVLSVVAAVISAVGAIASRKKVNAEADATITGSAILYAKELKADMDRLEDSNAKREIAIEELKVRLSKLERENEKLRAAITILSNQLITLGYKPLFILEG